MARTTNTYDRLVELAAERHGYVRVDAAADIGLRPEYLRKLAAVGRLEHCARGLYRLNAIPKTEHDEYHENDAARDNRIGDRNARDGAEALRGNLYMDAAFMSRG